jgi:hypothetical protein
MILIIPNCINALLLIEVAISRWIHVITNTRIGDNNQNRMLWLTKITKHKMYK